MSQRDRKDVVKIIEQIFDELEKEDPPQSASEKKKRLQERAELKRQLLQSDLTLEELLASMEDDRSNPA